MDIYCFVNVLVIVFGLGLLVVVFFYGGSWNEGSCKDYVFVGEVLSLCGFIVVLFDYCVYFEVCYFDFVKDSV